MTSPFNVKGDEHPRVTAIKYAYKNSDIEVINIYDEELTQKQLKITKRFGMLKMRYCRFARDKLYEILGAPIDGNFPQLYNDSDYVRKQQYDFDRDIIIEDYEPPKTFKQIREELNNNNNVINSIEEDDFPEAQGVENVKDTSPHYNNEFEFNNNVVGRVKLF